jgi:hypothetical protein
MPGLLQIRAVVEHSGVFGKVDLTTGTFWAYGAWGFTAVQRGDYPCASVHDLIYFQVPRTSIVELPLQCWIC